VVETGFWDAPLSSLTTPAGRLFANILASGHGGGHDLHLRTLRTMGVTLAGHFLGVEDGQVRFGPDLEPSVAWGDERYAQFMDLVRNTVRDRGLRMPEIASPTPFDGRAPERMDLAGFATVIFAGGFRPDYQSWVRLPGAFDDLGFPIHDGGGASTVAPGLYFVGAHFLRKRKSSLLYGVGEDATIVARSIAERRPAFQG
jgi:putative flavoprotein involved in K+ transport